jgi:hypothetical protein
MSVTPEEVLGVLEAKAPIQPRDLVREFRATSESVEKAVEKLIEEEKIYTDKGGNLNIKR